MTKFLIEIKEGISSCDTCPYNNYFNCESQLKALNISCGNYDFSTLKITKQE